MSKHNRKETSAIDRMKKILREQRLEEEKQFGVRRSKSWNTRPSVKQDRHQEKQKLRNIRNINDYTGDDE